MKQKGLCASALLCALLASAHTASAHQPAYIDTQTAVSIPDADTSRAYYGELTGTPAMYTISSDKDFSLYLNILSPYLPGAKQDFSVTVTNATGTTIATLNAPVTAWQEWYEEFAGDTYWKGPEFKQPVPAGTYTISVSNPGNTGKYVLAPGEAEVFSVKGTPSTIQEIYLVKTYFFEKPWYSVFEGIIGKVLLGMLALFTALLCLIVFILYRRTRKSN
ncbi:MAG: hypothetical protein JW384_00342 [Nitrosomonadaceae bacterium]|nr:hypothetical protein [Nitrosomonadaceae bacterium]